MHEAWSSIARLLQSIPAVARQHWKLLVAKERLRKVVKGVPCFAFGGFDPQVRALVPAGETSHWAMLRFKRGGRGWDNPTRKARDGPAAGGAKQELRTAEQVDDLSQPCMRL